MKKSWILVIVIGSALVLTACGNQAKSQAETTISTTELEELDETEFAETVAVLAEEVGEKQGEGTLFRENLEDFAEYTEVVESSLSVPSGFELKEVQTDIVQNEEKVVRLRYGREGEESPLFGKHYSVVLREEDQLLLGFITITSDSIIEDESELPSIEETNQLIETFLVETVPGYFEKLDHNFTGRHDEPLIINDEEVLVVGMKYKAYVPSDGDYAWVIVNKNRDVISFERGIGTGVDTIRGTEKWLYDEYLYDGSLNLFSFSDS